MRRDKNGHAWKWSPQCSGHAVCPFCGVEQKPSLKGAKGGSRVGYRRIGTRSWSAEAPQCLRAIRLDGYVRHRGMLAHVNSVAHDWPPRLECVVSGRKVTVLAMSYWRARNKENEK